MDNARIARIVAALAHDGPQTPSGYPQRVCTTAVQLLGMSGAGLTLMSEGNLGARWASDETVRRIEEAQLGLGEGPGIDAFRLGVPTLEPDMAHPSSRWPFFREAILDLGMAALFAFPLQVGVICFGVITLYRKDPGFLTDDQLANALILVDVATQDLLDLQALGQLPSGGAEARGHSARVHQATGMIAAQIDETMSNALARLRAHAFSGGTTIYDVAEEVLARRLRFD
jgi:hypothetical protein